MHTMRTDFISSTGGWSAMIHKDDLKGKYVEYRDRQGAFRIGKVQRVIGNTLTIANVLKQKERVHLDQVFCWIHHGHIKEPITGGRRTE